MLGCASTASNRIAPLETVNNAKAPSFNATKMKKWNSDHVQGQNFVMSPHQQRPCKRFTKQTSFGGAFTFERSASPVTIPSRSTRSALVQPQGRTLKRYENGPIEVRQPMLPIQPSSSLVAPSARPPHRVKSGTVVTTQNIHPVAGLFLRHQDLEALTVLGPDRLVVYRTVHMVNNHTKVIIGRNVMLTRSSSTRRNRIRRHPALAVCDSKPNETLVFVGSPHAFRAIMRERERRSAQSRQHSSDKEATIPSVVKAGSKSASRSCMNHSQQFLEKIGEASSCLSNRIKLVAVVSFRKSRAYFGVAPRV